MVTKDEPTYPYKRHEEAGVFFRRNRQLMFNLIIGLCPVAVFILFYAIHSDALMIASVTLSVAWAGACTMTGATVRHSKARCSKVTTLTFNEIPRNVWFEILSVKAESKGFELECTNEIIYPTRLCVHVEVKHLECIHLVYSPLKAKDSLSRDAEGNTFICIGVEDGDLAHVMQMMQRVAPPYMNESMWRRVYLLSDENLIREGKIRSSLADFFCRIGKTYNAIIVTRPGDNCSIGFIPIYQPSPNIILDIEAFLSEHPIYTLREIHLASVIAQDERYDTWRGNSLSPMCLYTFVL